MPIEAGTTISNLDALWPLSGDFLIDGDNHLRLIKAVLKSQFPGELGDGFAKPIIATEDEINYLGGLTSNVQEQLDAITSDDALMAPQGTVLPFYQEAPPVGWTQVTTQDDAMLRVVNTLGGGAGGTDSIIDFDFSHVHATVGHALIISEIPSHNHGGGFTGDAFKDTSNGFEEQEGPKAWSKNSLQSEGGGNAHDHGDTLEGDLTFSPKYINVIIASKD